MIAVPSKALMASFNTSFDGTAIIVSHDREFLDGLVTKVYEFGGGGVREHIGGIYYFLRDRNGQLEVRGERLEFAKAPSAPKVEKPEPRNEKADDYAARKEQQKKLRKAERAVEESEKKIAQMENRLKELDQLLCDPKNASDMMLVTEYTDIKRQLDEEVERWEQLSETLENLQ